VFLIDDVKVKESESTHGADHGGLLRPVAEVSTFMGIMDAVWSITADTDC